MILAPAFHHGSEIEAAVRAGMGVRFYDVDERLGPPSDLDDLVDGSTKALHLSHVLGIPQDAEKWRRWADDRGLLLIEDVAQGWPGSVDGRPLGTWGDISIFCLYKTLGVPDGGVVLSASPTPRPAAGQVGSGRLLRRHAAWAIARSRSAASALTRFQRSNWLSHEEDIGLGDPSRGPTVVTRCLLRRAYSEDVAASRRANFVLLKDGLSDLFSPAFDVGLSEASPFAFPIEVPEKEEVDRTLTRLGVGAERFWTWPHPLLQPDRFPRATRLRKRLLALPVHQELRRSDLERIVEATRSAIGAVARS